MGCGAGDVSEETDWLPTSGSVSLFVGLSVCLAVAAYREASRRVARNSQVQHYNSVYLEKRALHNHL